MSFRPAPNVQFTVMDEFLTDQQQAARVRGWIREYAPPAIVAVAVGLGGYFGFAQWQDHKAGQAADASELYAEFEAALESSNPDSATELQQRILADFEGSGYADHARLRMAKEYVDTTQPSLAAEELKSLIETSSDGDLRQLARLRLARVYLYMDLPEQGLEVLQTEVHSPAWEQLTEDMRGDLHQALGQIDEARAAYQAALERTGQVDAGWIRLKLDHLGAAGISAGEDPEDGSGQTAETEPAPDMDAAPEADEGPDTDAAPEAEEEPDTDAAPPEQE